ncbi:MULTISPECIES: signal peptidase I [Thermococcus]|uniref:Signal peptidase I n=1 Tax=Thermococcus aciditolerans TaxID=2598455 RepID=A0A5C0SL72_9EURY|nr:MULTISPECIES: signal peptidase I [Thermococcus]NJE01905.1 signal peptidase I [Thermococcus sp. JdF3]QEK15123.1 signal peptidase I [Thermococcus aciditolerans]
MVKRRIDVLSIISYLLLFFVVLVMALHFVFGFQYVVILTDSMEPHINPNDLVITMPSSPDGLHVGDVILYRVTLGNSTYMITHRIVGMKADPEMRMYYITKGDNRNYTDPWRVYYSQVVGRVVLVIPRVGVVWYYTPLIVFGIFLFIIASLAYDLAWLLLEEEPLRSKSRKADLVALRRKKIKAYYHRRR